MNVDTLLTCVASIGHKGKRRSIQSPQELRRRLDGWAPQALGGGQAQERPVFRGVGKGYGKTHRVCYAASLLSTILNGHGSDLESFIEELSKRSGRGPFRRFLEASKDKDEFIQLKNRIREATDLLQVCTFHQALVILTCRRIDHWNREDSRTNHSSASSARRNPARPRGSSTCATRAG